MNSNCELLKSYPDVLSPSDIMEILKVGKNTTYFLLKNKKIQSIKIGKQYKIPKVFLLKYLLDNVEMCI